MIKRIAKIIGIGFSLGLALSVFLNWYTHIKYEVPEHITVKKIENRYGSLLLSIEELYYLNDTSTLRERINSIKANMPQDDAILELTQQDKGKTNSYGVDYFYYQKEDYIHSYVYRDSAMRKAGGLMRGHVETGDGKKIQIISYKKLIKNDNESLEINLVLDYQHINEQFTK